MLNSDIIAIKVTINYKIGLGSWVGILEYAKESLIITLVILAVINDLYNYRVSNKIIFPFCITGIMYNLLLENHQYFVSSIIGLAVPLVILFPLYITKMFGAGDIKLFSALGAFIGLRPVLTSMAYSFIAGAIIALIIMLIRRNALQRFKYFITYIKCCLLSMTIIPYSDFSEKNDGTKMHFTIPIALGTILVLAC